MEYELLYDGGTNKIQTSLALTFALKGLFNLDPHIT